MNWQQSAVAVLSLAALVCENACAQRTTQLRAPPSDAGPHKGNPACVRVRLQNIYSIGYEHRVVVDNGCSQTVACDVATNVDPSPMYSLTVAPGQSGYVTTRRGAPGQATAALSRCELVR